MKRLAWITDPHFNFVHLNQWDALLNRVACAKVDAVLLTGDISEAEDVVWQLARFASATELPLYFVLGNHDFYQGSVAVVRRTVSACAAPENPRLNYLHTKGPIHIGDWSLCGVDGWADGQIGDYYRSPVKMHDFELIEDLQGLTAADRLARLKALGEESAHVLREQLHLAQAESKQVLVLTHIPPFREACWYEGETSNDDWAPFFTCYAVGQVLSDFCNRFPKHFVRVLCGHTHSPGRTRIRDNLDVWTAGAVYGKPEVAEVLEIHD